MRVLASLLVATAVCGAQNFTERGFLETFNEFYPDTTPLDDSHAISEELLRYEAQWKFLPGFQLNAGFDGRFDSHHEVDRSLHLDWADRGLQRPALSVRELNVTYTHKRLTVTAGKQFVRWGKADILNPTDRFAPRDYLDVSEPDFLAIDAVRVVYDSGLNSLDVIWQPRFTPSRIPLLDQRWTILPTEAQSLLYADFGSIFPGRQAEGIRWDHAGSTIEYSFNFYNGTENLPQFLLPPIGSPYAFAIERFFPQLTSWGADAAAPLSWVTVKGETEFFTSKDKRSDEFLLYVLQLEKQVRELSLVGGYSGEIVVESRSPLFFNPERGFARSFIGRAQYSIDPRRELTAQGIVRQNGKGELLELNYSETFGQHWRATVGYTFIGGVDSDFIGEYHENSHATVALRYSF